MGLCKGIVRLGVIGGLATGAVVVAAQASPRFAALLGQTKARIIGVIDSQIDDPVALRAQLRDLERQYPARITEVRGELSQVDRQIAALKQDKLVAAGVVELVTADLGELKGLLDQAEAARTNAPTRIISVRFDGNVVPLDQAYAEGTRLRATLAAYATRVQDAERDIAFLTEQRDRLTELATTLESEQVQFQSQIWQLDSQIEMIERNEKMIELVEDRARRLDELDRFEASSLNHLTERMASIRAEQEQRLAQLTRKAETDYEQQVKARLDAEKISREAFENASRGMVISPQRLIIDGTTGAHDVGADNNEDQTVIIGDDADDDQPTGPVASTDRARWN
ncbi:MAG: hypothetical protein ACTS3F_00630 [Phycisphaerales bacterium]